MKNKDIERLQDAIGEIKDEYIDEAAKFEAVEEMDAATEFPGAPQGWQGSSWVSMAMNPARGKKLKEGKDKGYKNYQKFTAIAACAILVVCLVVPKLMPKGEGPLMDGVDEKAEYEMSAETATSSAEENAAAPMEPDASAEFDEAAPGDEKGESSEAMEPADTEPGDMPVEPPTDIDQGEAFRLTAAEWNDNENWPFFSNLVNSGVISFPSFGIDPRNRIKVTVTDEGGETVVGEEVALLDGDGSALWRGTTNKEGVAYLFFQAGEEPASVDVKGTSAELVINTPSDDPQGEPSMERVDDINVVVASGSKESEGLQVMFIVDTTGSMGDELAYLQKDFASIAEETFDGSTYFSVNFYRDEGDEYVTKTNDFTQNLATVQNMLNEEYASGGGDTPEAVAEILAETITYNDDWRSDCNKVAFLIFDAPPHVGTEETVAQAAKSAAEYGIHLVPVVASNAERDTELFGRALAIVTGGTYVFLTDDSGIGESHLEPIVGDYEVELLHDVIVRIINSYK